NGRLPEPCDPSRRVRRRDDPRHLEIDDVAPARDPYVEQLRVVALHHVEALREIRRHPARDVPQSVRREPSLLPEAPVDGRWVAVLEALDDHVERPRHRPISVTGRGGGASNSARTDSFDSTRIVKMPSNVPNGTNRHEMPAITRQNVRLRWLARKCAEKAIA